MKKTLLWILKSGIYSFMLMLCVSSICSAEYPQKTTTPLTADLSMNEKKLTGVGDIITKGPWVDVRNYASINAAVSAIGSTRTTLLVPNAQTLTANLTIPSNIHLVILQGGSIAKASTYTLTINGPFDAPLAQVFSGFSAGDVKFGAGYKRQLYLQWVGGVADWDGSTGTNNSPYILLLKSALPSVGGEILITEGKWRFVAGNHEFGEGVVLRGIGQANAAQCIHDPGSGSSDLFIFGGSNSGVYHGCGAYGLYILLRQDTTGGVRLKGTVGAVLEDIYIEGVGGGSRGVYIDGGNASTYLNTLKNVNCNHVGVGFGFVTSGSEYGTTSLLLNCSSFGDVSTNPTSVGIAFDQYQGNGSIVIGGNLESCGTGIYRPNGSGSATFIGVRFEANTVDIRHGTTTNPATFVGCHNIDNITQDGTSGDWLRHTYYGCSTSAGLLRGDTIPRMTTAQRNALTIESGGTRLIYNTSTNKLNFYNGSAWEVVTSA